MKKTFSLLFAGALFGVGLVLSGMTQPAKVIGFLDVTGAWDPSLGFVMAGAIGVHAVLNWRIRKQPRPVFEPAFERVRFSAIDGRLVAGSALFGVGWGLGGYCPGPALVALGSFTLEPWVLTLGMVVGIVAFHALERLRQSGEQSEAVASDA